MANKIVISVGPIPAKLSNNSTIRLMPPQVDDDTIAAFLHTAVTRLAHTSGSEVTIIAWKHTDLSALPNERNINVVQVENTDEYIEWFEKHIKEYDTFILSATLSKLMPTGHSTINLQYDVNIQFRETPRIINLVKEHNPDATLIGYAHATDGTDDIMGKAQKILLESNADIIFTWKDKDMVALLKGGATIECSFNGHVQIIQEAVKQEYYRTMTAFLLKEERDDPGIMAAFEDAKAYGEYGVLVPVKGRANMYVSKMPGEEQDPILVREVNHNTRTIFASGECIAHLPAMQAILNREKDKAVVFLPLTELLKIPKGREDKAPAKYIPHYLFPGSVKEVETAKKCKSEGYMVVDYAYHGAMKVLPLSTDKKEPKIPDGSLKDGEGLTWHHDGTNYCLHCTRQEDPKDPTVMTGEYGLPFLFKEKNESNVSIWNDALKALMPDKWESGYDDGMCKALISDKFLWTRTRIVENPCIIPEDEKASGRQAILFMRRSGLTADECKSIMNETIVAYNAFLTGNVYEITLVMQMEDGTWNCEDVASNCYSPTFENLTKLFPERDYELEKALTSGTYQVQRIERRTKEYFDYDGTNRVG